MPTPITTWASERCSSASPARGRSRRPAVVEAIKATLDVQAEQWSALFGDAAVKPTVLPEPMAGDVIDLEGAELRVIEVGQGDIRPSTVLHVPAIDTVVAGDVIYNQIHAMLGLSGPTSGRTGSPASTGSSGSGRRRSSPATRSRRRAIRRSRR